MGPATNVPPVIAAIQKLGFNVTHVYGLTETYGPAVVCDWQEDWNELGPTEQALKKGRQGARYHVLEDLTVADPETLEPVPSDGKTLGALETPTLLKNSDSREEFVISKPKLKKILAGIRSGKLRRLSLSMKSRKAREYLFSHSRSPGVPATKSVPWCSSNIFTCSQAGYG